MIAAPRVLILRAPGTNCDEETAYAFDIAGGVSERVHVNRLIENPTLGSRYQILCIPGGFSYGDDIAAGRILASRLNRHLADMVRSFCDQDRLVLGICNGFQVLMRLGILTSGISESTPATLAWNDSGRFEDRWVHLRTDRPAEPATSCVFLRGIERMYLPMAHAEGKFLAESPETFAKLAAAGRLPLRYAMCEENSASGGATEAGGPAASGDELLQFPHNPNGAQGNVAGVCDASGRLFGLMPHPERHIDATHHPYWTRRDEQPEYGDGYPIFKNAVDYFA